ncbi:bifunctional 2-polyprenyl-6-hydroxyphenol methylase/3-demethylubiquinol 3-O-methyltransferase UbiG [Mycobacterium sp. GA-2829]|uniref:class I SAM-dependent methyltransferase n=1 Tax=Mycobacterium sp. GA-2829 TaxID=1772283 RepID=UPI0007404349|nr:class I SAM-dependent methyltransferase [Mycobacterium sp. GA-2829]KUI26351.1 SAM-dependent methyltransferase [Mycobacterium sp. GA-2829]
MSETVRFWEEHYGANERVWSGRVNVQLAKIVEPLAPGRALDLGCGEGADAIWLAGRGWQVVAVDVSKTALDRAAEDAAAAGVAERIRFEWHDLTETFPEGGFDLVSAQFFHSPLDVDRTAALRRAAGAVVPGGSLLIVDHGATPEWTWKDGQPHDLPTLQETLDSLALDPGQWERLRADEVERAGTSPDGQSVTWVDNVILLRRR